MLIKLVFVVTTIEYLTVNQLPGVTVAGGLRASESSLSSVCWA